MRRAVPVRGRPAGATGATGAAPCRMDSGRQFEQFAEGHRKLAKAVGLQALAEHGMLDRGLRVRPMVLPDTYIDHDTPAAMYAKAGLDAKGIVAKAFEALGKSVSAETVRLA